MAERTQPSPKIGGSKFRIGINVGDIIIDEDDIYGGRRQHCRRIEALASPGAICLSENAYAQVKGKLTIDVSNMEAGA